MADDKELIAVRRLGPQQARIVVTFDEGLGTYHLDYTLPPTPPGAPAPRRRGAEILAAIGQCEIDKTSTAADDGRPQLHVVPVDVHEET